MKLSAIVCLAAATWAAGAAAEPVRLRVLAYNIHHGEGLDGRLDLDRIAGVIRDADADVVLLQEVDQRVERSGDVDQPEELARLTEMQAAFGDNLKLGDGRYGNAVLSRFPILRRRNHRLPRPHESEPRGVLEVELEMPSDAAPLTVFCTHFDHRYNEERRLAAKFVLERAVELGDRPLLLGGDLNATPESPPLETLARRWRRTGGRDAFTSPSVRPRRKIDYVLVAGAGWRLIETAVVEEPTASDHRPVLAVLELDGGQGAQESREE